MHNRRNQGGKGHSDSSPVLLLSARGALGRLAKQPAVWADHDATSRRLSVPDHSWAVGDVGGPVRTEFDLGSRHLRTLSAPDAVRVVRADQAKMTSVTNFPLVCVRCRTEETYKLPGPLGPPGPGQHPQGFCAIFLLNSRPGPPDLPLSPCSQPLDTLAEKV